MSKISDFASNSIMGVVRKIVNHIVDNVDPQISDATDHLPARFSGTFNDNTRNLTMTIESQGASAENLVATVNIPAGGGGSGGPTYSAGNGINITPENAIEIDTAVTATKQSVDTLQAQVGDAFSQVAIGADGKSLDFTALDGQVNNIALPSSGGSNEWISFSSINDINISNIKPGTQIAIYFRPQIEGKIISITFSGIVRVVSSSDFNVISSGHMFKSGKSHYISDIVYYITTKKLRVYYYENYGEAASYLDIEMNTHSIDTGLILY